MWLTMLRQREGEVQHLIALVSELSRGVAHLAVVLAERFVEMRDHMDGQQVSQKGLPLQHDRQCISLKDHPLSATANWQFSIFLAHKCSNRQGQH